MFKYSKPEMKWKQLAH